MVEDARIGRSIAGKYRVRSMIGEGGMGSVYDAVELASGARVALKVLRAGRDGVQRVERLRREALAIAALRHPNIVRLLDQGMDSDGTAFVVMERLAGETLKARMDREGRLSPRFAASVALELLEGLRAAHEAGIVHRDIKPTNVMLVPDANGRERVVILDFGVAKLFAAGELRTLTTTGQMIGTPAYMSPEQARGETIDPRTDVHAVGVLLYRALAGRVPYVGKDTADMIFQVLAGEKVPIERVAPDAEPELARIVTRAMARKASDRFATAEEMRREILAWLSRDSGAPTRVPDTRSGDASRPRGAPGAPAAVPVPVASIDDAAPTRRDAPRGLPPPASRADRPRRTGALALALVAVASAAAAGLCVWLLDRAARAPDRGIEPAPGPGPVPVPMAPNDAGPLDGAVGARDARALVDAGAEADAAGAPDARAAGSHRRPLPGAFSTIGELRAAAD